MVQLTDKHPEADNHLLHIWEARRGLVKRWQEQKHNRTLKKRIANITLQAVQYAHTLTVQNWHSLSDQLKGTLSTKRTWHILRKLIGDKPTRTTNTHQINRLIRNSDLPPSELLHALRDHLFGHQTTSSRMQQI